MGKISVVNKTQKTILFELWQVTPLYSVELAPGEEWGYSVGAVHFTVYARYRDDIKGCYNKRGWYFKGRNYLEVTDDKVVDNQPYLTVNRVLQPPPPNTDKADSYHRWVRVWSKTGYVVKWTVLDSGMLTCYSEHYRCSISLKDALITEYNDAVYTIQSQCQSNKGQLWHCQASSKGELDQWRGALELAGTKYRRINETVALSTGAKVAIGVGVTAGLVLGAAVGAAAAPVALIGVGVAEATAVGIGAAGGAAAVGAIGGVVGRETQKAMQKDK